VLAYRPVLVPVRFLAQGTPAQAAAKAPEPVPERCKVAEEILFGIGGTVFGAAAAWVGARSGLRDKGPYSALGWGVAAVGGLFAVFSAAGALGLRRGTVML